MRKKKKNQIKFNIQTSHLSRQNIPRTSKVISITHNSFKKLTQQIIIPTLSVKQNIQTNESDSTKQFH